MAVEALVEEDDIEVAQQNEKMARYNHQIAVKKNELDGLRRAMHTGKITDEVFFLSR